MNLNGAMASLSSCTGVRATKCNAAITLLYIRGKIFADDLWHNYSHCFIHPQTTSVRIYQIMLYVSCCLSSQTASHKIW